VARNVVEPDAIVVEVVKDRKAVFVALSVVWLCPSSTSSVGPPDVVVPPAAGPPDVPASHVAAGPEVLLPLSAHETQELSLLRAAVDRDRSHPVRSAEARRLALSERGAAKSPGHEVVASVEAVVRTVASSTSTSSSIASVASVASVAPVAIVLGTVSSATKQVPDEASKSLRGSCSQAESSKKEDD